MESIVKVKSIMNNFVEYLMCAIKAERIFKNDIACNRNNNNNKIVKLQNLHVF